MFFPVYWFPLPSFPSFRVVNSLWHSFHFSGWLQKLERDTKLEPRVGDAKHAIFPSIARRIAGTSS